MTTSRIDFLSLAEREASRYGDESLVFLRELLQNARDAGAHTVSVEIEWGDGGESISVVDDGCGMDIDHARRFLLTLYASSKGRSSGAAGRFGVGFWSVLRFGPSEILIKSRVRSEAEGWELIFNSDLELTAHRRCTMAVGTSVVLKRAARGGDLQQLSWEMIRRDARHLRRRDDPESLVEVTVNGRLATEPMVADHPGLLFRRPGLRGVISLGPEPGVTLLAHGLRVRSAASVDDLLLRPGRHRGPTSRLPASGLSPRVVVDSDRLAVLMDRGDVAQDRHLERVSRIIRSETRRLCELELERLAPRTWWRRLQDGVLRRRLQIALAALAVSVSALGLWGAQRFTDWQPRASGTSRPVGDNHGFEPFVDQSEAYGGPVTNSIEGTGSAPLLRYDPPDLHPYLAAFRVNGIDDDGRPIRHQFPLRRAQESRVRTGEGIEIEIRFQAAGSLLRLPVPTGHRVESRTVRLDGQPVDLWLTADDEPAIRVAAGNAGRVAYRTFEDAVEGTTVGKWPSLQPSIKEIARELSALPPAQRIGPAIDVVRDSVGQAGSFEGRNLADSAPGKFVRSVFLARGGDCDVINTILAAVLAEAGLNSRLAVGWVGAGGVPVAGLHAWVEVDLGAGRWVAADATLLRSDDPIVRVRRPDQLTSATENSGGDFDRDPKTIGCVVWYGPFGLAIAVLGVIGSRHFRIRRRYVASENPDPGPLVESLVRDREAWPGYSQARLRAIVPGVRSRRYSLAEIEAAALKSNAFVSAIADETTSFVEQGGGLIIDGTTRAGRVAAAAFGAFDLNFWDSLWNRAAISSFTCEIEECIRREGFSLELRSANDVPGGAMGFALDGENRGRVVVDENLRDWRVLHNECDTSREEAVLRATDRVFEAMPGAKGQGERVLAALARRVLAVVSLPSEEIA